MVSRGPGPSDAEAHTEADTAAVEQARAVTAARRLARRLGLKVVEPAVLHSSNNVLVWLSPSRVVAKVSTSRYERAAEEIETADYLAFRGAPVVGPAPEIPSRVYSEHAYPITFWRYIPAGGETASPAAVAASLHHLHSALASLPASIRREPLPLADELAAVRRVLDGLAVVSALAPSDRAVLAACLEHGISELTGQHKTARVLHGSPHDANILSLDGQPLFIDFETVVRGPLEWDLAHLDDNVAAAYPETHDQRLLASCRTLVSAQVAVWCWAGAARHPDLGWHAKHHLAAVKHALC